MNELKALLMASTRRANRFDQRHFLKPDSALVRTAVDLLTAHVTGGAEGESASCRLCGLRFPCPTVRHARQVVDAGGVQHAIDGPAERDPAPVSSASVSSVPVSSESTSSESVSVESVSAESISAGPADKGEAEAPVREPVGAA